MLQFLLYVEQTNAVGERKRFLFKKRKQNTSHNTSKICFTFNSSVKNKQQKSMKNDFLRNNVYSLMAGVI